MEQPDNVLPVQTVVRLKQHVYEALEKSLGAPFPASNGDTAYALGIQRVLYELRKGIVVNDNQG